MMITLQSRPCPGCGVENMLDAAGCHSCGRAFRCARAQVLEVEAPIVRPRPKMMEKSPLGHCVARIDALLHRKYDISTLKFD